MTDRPDGFRFAALATMAEEAVGELDAVHRPVWASSEARAAGKEPTCVSRQVADDLRRVLERVTS